MSVGTWFKRHTPLSHMGYWQDRGFQRYVATYLQRLLAACKDT
nr:hypothetical protein [Pseudomonas sp. Ga0074129]